MPSGRCLRANERSSRTRSDQGDIVAMDVSMLDAAGHALLTILDPSRLIEETQLDERLVLNFGRQSAATLSGPDLFGLTVGKAQDHSRN